METGDDKHKLIYRETDVQKDTWAQAYLSIQVTSNTFSWCITDAATDMVLEVGKVNRQATDEFLPFIYAGVLETAVHDVSFHSVTWSVKGAHSVLIPSGLFDEGQQKRIFDFHFGESSKDLIHCGLSTGDIILIQEIDREVENAILKRYPHAIHILNAAVLIESMMKKSRFDKTPQVLLDIEHEFAELIIAQQGKLLIHTRFDWSNSEDVLFHLANTCDQLGLDIQAVQVMLTGQVELDSDLFKLLNGYLNNLRMHFGFTFSKMGKSLSRVRKQEFMTLLNQYSCA